MTHTTPAGNVWTLHTQPREHWVRAADGGDTSPIYEVDTDSLDAFDKLHPVRHLQSGFTFWHVSSIAGMCEIEVGGMSDIGQNFRGRTLDGEWELACRSDLLRWYNERVPPPEVDTLAGIVRGVMAGWFDAKGLEVVVDGGVYADRKTGVDDPEFEELWASAEDDPAAVLVELLNGLGVPARRA